MKLLLAVAFLLVASVTAQYGTEIQLSGGGLNPMFPPFCQCDRIMTHAPYRIGLAPSPDATQLCFSVAVVPCDSRYKCCSMDLYKFELDAKLSAKSNVKAVYVDGVKRSFEFNGRLSVIRIVNIHKTTANATGTTICIKTQGLSADLVTDLCKPGAGSACQTAVFNSGMKKNCCPITFSSPPPPPPPCPSPPPPPPPPCPSPPPPPSPSPPPPPPPPCPSPNPLPPPPLAPAPLTRFPYCVCDRNAGPLTLGQPTSAANSDGTTTFCFTVQDTGYNSGPCSTMDLYKVELEVNTQCHGSLTYMSVNGVKRPPFFQTKPYAAIKINNLNKTTTTAVGTQVCIAVKPPCNTLSSLCTGGMCTAALFNNPSDQHKCCPITRGLSVL